MLNSCRRLSCGTRKMKDSDFFSHFLIFSFSRSSITFLNNFFQQKKKKNKANFSLLNRESPVKKKYYIEEAWDERQMDVKNFLMFMENDFIGELIFYDSIETCCCGLTLCEKGNYFTSKISISHVVKNYIFLNLHTTISFFFLTTT